MIRVPAAGLGVIVILVASFFVGYRCTYYFASLIKSNEKTVNRKHEDNFTIGISITIGILSAIFAFSVFKKYAQSHSGEALLLLIVLGFVVSILSFLVPAIKASERQSVQSAKERATRVVDVDYEAERNKEERKCEYYYKRHRATLKRYELLLSMLLSGWINFISKYVLVRKIFSEIYFASLMKLLERYIKINQIRVIEPFTKERKSISERILEFLVGVIEIEGVRIVIILEVMNNVITNITLSPYIVYLYNIQLENMIVYLTNTCDETASALLTRIKAQKKISLLQLDTMIAEIQKRNSYPEYLKGIIVQNNMH